MTTFLGPVHILGESLFNLARQTFSFTLTLLILAAVAVQLGRVQLFLVVSAHAKQLLVSCKLIPTVFASTGRELWLRGR